MNGLERRQQTLLMVSEYIVEAQKEFLRSASDKNAISNKEIANRLGISPSTVSRIVRNKYIQFPEKLIPLSQLMERRINKHNEGADVTEESLKSLILEMIIISRMRLFKLSSVTSAPSLCLLILLSMS